MGETGEREGRVGVICESDLRRLVFIDMACSKDVGKLAFVALNKWLGVNWQERENLYYSCCILNAALCIHLL